ncbi:MAG TPA: 1-phosphofructokinase family hexose kinase [Bryobacteraceae bacterium]
MILTLTINPAIDRTIAVEKLVFEDRAYIQSSTDTAGGRGVNASRVVHDFGGKTMAVLTAGGETGKRMQALLDSLGFPTDCVEVKSPTRTNLTISDTHGLTLKLNEHGAPITVDELKAVRQAVENRMAKASWLMICGSVPPGVPREFYAELIEMARAKKVKTLLDTDGDALEAGMEAKPTVVKPNQAEAERLLHRALISRHQVLDAVRELKAMGPETVILSLGGRGAIAATEHELLEAVPPRIDPVCPIGAGDALSAAFTWALSKRKTVADSLCWGVAAGTASTLLPGVETAGLEQTRAIYGKVEVRKLA